MANNSYILVLYYSLHGSTKTLAELYAEGIEQAGVEARVRTVPAVSAKCEKLEEAIPEQGPLYASYDDLKNCAGLVVGSPTRFGNMAAALKYFIDGTAPLWMNGELVDKPFGCFTSTTSMHGGQETTIMSMALPFLHHGMIHVGIPYTQPELSSTQSGGSPYGASHVSGANNLPFSDDEKKLAMAHGNRVATLTQKLK